MTLPGMEPWSPGPLANTNDYDKWPVILDVNIYVLHYMNPYTLGIHVDKYNISFKSAISLKRLAEIKCSKQFKLKFLKYLI